MERGHLTGEETWGERLLALETPGGRKWKTVRVRILCGVKAWSHGKKRKGGKLLGEYYKRDHYSYECSILMRDFWTCGFNKMWER